MIIFISWCYFSSIGSSLNSSPRSDLDAGVERFSRKVFVGGLPPDIDEGKLNTQH